MSSSGVNLENFLIPLEEINLATENFSPKTQIGNGGYGKVYRGQLSERWQNRTAAIKRLSPTSYQGEHEFRNELQMISRFSHQNIIPFIGYCDEGNEMIIVYEFAVNGSLDCHLQDPNKRRCITWAQRLQICIGAARGLKYLHSGLGEDNRVIHRDIKSANILLDDNLDAKISDFGLSRSGPRNQPYTQLYTSAAGTHFYLDPLYLESSILRKESDVYSFGVVLFEMLSGMLVFHGRRIGDDKPQTLITLVRHYYDDGLDKLIDPHIKDQIDSRSFHKFKEIAYNCISFNLKERPTMDRIIEGIQEALDIQEPQTPVRNLVTESDSKPKRPPIDGQHENVDALIQCVMKGIGFNQGKSIVAFTIYKCLLHWKSFEAERTSVFDRLILMIGSAFENHADNNDHMAYWLSNTSTLLFLIRRSLKPVSASSVQKLFGRMTLGFRSSPSAAELEVVRQVEAKYPALLFKQQLTACVEKMYVIIRDNLKKELAPLLSSSTAQARQRSKGGLRSQFNHWQGIVDCLNTLLNILKENFVPPIIVQKIFTQNFSYINAQLFNSLLLRRECCSLSHGEYVKAGLAELELWCFQAKEEYSGSAWDELKHIRQAAGFLVIHQKNKISYDKLANDLCPILSVQQLYRICTLFWDDKYNTRSVSPDVISRMRMLMTEDSNNAVSDTAFLLDDDSSIPFSVDDLSGSLQVNDFTDMKPAAELVENPAFHFLLV